MIEEVEKGVAFLCRVMNRDKKLDKKLVMRFQKCLITILCERFHDHWYPENPSKGQAYRCIRINRKQPVDDSLLKACKACGMDYSQVELPWEFTLWFDPSDVCCRLGENNYPFTVKNEDVEDEEVKNEETKSSKTESEVETSDYHSSSCSPCSSESSSSCSSCSTCSSEDEVSAKQGAMALAKSKDLTTGNGHKQGPEYYYMPKPRYSGLWVPHPENVVSFVIPGTGFQPFTIYYMDVGSTKAPAAKAPAAKAPAAKAPEAKPRNPNRNPNLVKRLTKRATRY